MLLICQFATYAWRKLLKVLGSLTGGSASVNYFIWK